MSNLRLVVTTTSGATNVTDLKGYLAETLGDKALREASEDKRTLVAILFYIYDGASLAPYADIRSVYKSDRWPKNG
jgi:hypothetical protein